ncbi:MAG: class I SAM-dependent methyltransferase [Vulcanimicrobiota bacterium]
MDDDFRSRVPEVTAPMLGDLRLVTARMARLGYDEENVAAALGLKHLSYFRLANILVYRARLKARGDLGIAISFWLLQQWVSLEDARGALGDHAVSVLQQLGWLRLSSAGLRSRVDLYPCCGRYFFTDSANNVFPWPEQVYWLGFDSYTLAYCTPRQPRQRSLDICTGSGVHAILARAHCQQSLGLDINPRALAFSRLNARLNRLGAEFEASDCYQAVEGQQFDLITLNPPFVPTPEQVPELYRAGGSTGESITRRVMEGLPRFLRPGGLFSMATEAARRPGESPVDRMKSWLGKGWGIVALYKHEFAVEDYILGHVLGSVIDSQERDNEFQRWLDTYQSAKIVAMTAAHFYAWPLPEGVSSWAWEHSYPPPFSDQSVFLGDWLQALQAWHLSLPGDFQPRIHAGVEQIYFAADGGALVEWKGNHWCQAPTRLTAEQTRVVSQIQQGASLSELDQTIVRHLGCSLVLTHP